MGFFSKLKDILSPSDDIQIDFADYKFVATCSRRGKLIAARKLAASPVMVNYVSGIHNSDEATLPLSVDSVKRLYNDAFCGVLKNSKQRIVFSPNASKIHFQELRNEWVIKYTFEPTGGGLLRTLPDKVIELASGYFLRENVVWWIADPAIAQMSSIQNVRGADILPFAKLDGNVCLCSSIRLLENASAGHLSAQAASMNKLIVNWTSCIQPESAVYLEGLTGYVMSGDKLYKGLPGVMRNSYFKSSNTVTLVDTEIPAFAQKYQNVIRDFGDQSARFVFGLNTILFGLDDIELVLCCKNEIKNGVGSAVTVPMLKHGSGIVLAKEVSEGITNGFARIGEKWIAEETLLKLGIGPLGRLADGTQLEPIVLRTDEILRRGSDRLTGPWNEMLFGQPLKTPYPPPPKSAII